MEGQVLIEVHPVAHQEFHTLKGDLVLVRQHQFLRLHPPLALLLVPFVCPFVTLFLALPHQLPGLPCEGDAAVLGKQSQVLQVVFLDPVLDIVNLVGGKQGTQAENASRQIHRRLVVEHALRVHQQHGHLLPVRHSSHKGFRPHPNARCRAFLPRAPLKTRLQRVPTVVTGQDLFVYVPLPQVPCRCHPILTVVQLGSIPQVTKQEGQQKRFSCTKSPHHGDDGNLHV